MRTKDKRKEIIILFVSIILTIGLCWIIVDPVVQLSPGKGLDRSVYTNSDSILIENRHIGYINYEKFVSLINSVLPQMCTIEYINRPHILRVSLFASFLFISVCQKIPHAP